MSVGRNESSDPLDSQNGPLTGDLWASTAICLPVNGSSRNYIYRKWNRSGFEPGEPERHER